MNKDILGIVENVKSGKTIIYIGKDLIMMNMAKYHEYVNLEKEPVSKRILQAKCEELEKVLSIINEKNVDILDVKVYENYKHYCNAKESSKIRKDWWLTEEEFNTLKEYFNER